MEKTIFETNVNRLVLKAVLLDMVTFIKFGRHLAPNWQSGKNQVCNACGLNFNAHPKTVIKAIKKIYIDNKLEDDFNATMQRMKAENLIGE